MIFTIGGLALGLTSTKSKLASLAILSASFVGVSPFCSPNSSIKKTLSHLIWLLILNILSSFGLAFLHVLRMILLSYLNVLYCIIQVSFILFSFKLEERKIRKGC